MATVANKGIDDGHNNQQTMRANDYKKMVFNAGGIRSAKQDDNYGASNIVLPCPSS
jgi:hypothetical protein